MSLSLLLLHLDGQNVGPMASLVVDDDECSCEPAEGKSTPV